MRRALALLAALAAPLGCTCDGTPAVGDAGPPGPVPSGGTAAPTAPGTRSPTYDLIEHLDACEIRHQGLSIDMGTASVGARRGFTLDPPGQLDVVDRGGASFERVHDQRVVLDFWLDEDVAEGTVVAARIHGGGARRVTAYVDDKRLGTAKLTRGETSVVAFPSARVGLTRGRHRLGLRFWQAKRGPREPYAEIDWIRIDPSGAATGTYAAPTLRDVVADLELAGKPRRSIVLRKHSSLRCPLVPAGDAELRVALGIWGSGRGDVEVRVVQDGEPPVTMQQRKIEGGTDARWIPLRIDLSAYAGQLIGVELRALHTSGGGRVAFGDPAVGLRRSVAARVPQARVVVLLVAAGLDRRRIPPGGPIGELAALGEVARVGTAFTQYRVPTTVPAGVFASLLTGLPPGAHTVEDPSARLPPAVRTVNEIVKQASGRTAFFSAVPTTFGAFGFDSDWDRFEAFSPVHDVPATEAYTRAAQWLEHELDQAGPSRVLLVVHGRGGHPPWDLTQEEVARLRPEEYGGVLDARRGGITLGKLRSRRRRSQRKLPERDWERLRALHDAALLKQDVSVAQLIDVLKRRGVWEQTLFVFCGDVGVGDPPSLPFDPLGRLSEDRLLVPLLVKFPGEHPRSGEASAPAGSTDVARTILEALRLDVPPHLHGVDLYRLAAGVEPPAGRARVATLGPRYSSRMGTWLLSGEFGRVPKLCQLDVDPSCSTDVYDQNPIAAQATWRFTYRAEVSAREAPRRAAAREAASVDADTAAALTVWGDLQ